LTLTQWLYFLSLVIGVVATVAMQNLKRSARGRALRAIEMSEPMAVAMGVNVSRERIVVFVISSVYASLAGGLYALVSGAVAPDAFTFVLSANLLIGAVVGGVTSPIGALLGGALVAIVPTMTASLQNSLPEYIFGGAVLLVVYLRPKGIASIPAGVVALVRQRSSRRAAQHQKSSTDMPLDAHHPLQEGEL
jgi:branched-chain amino acid transport system permease protein